MRKILIALSQVALLILVASCAKEPPTESGFIDMGGSESGGAGNPFWEWADTYPGNVNSAAERVGGAVVEVKGGFEPLAFSPGTPVLLSTGLYAGSDERVIVEVPEGVDNLHWQIGIGQPLYSVTIQTAQRRYTDVTTKGKLEGGKSNSISSYFGGYLYFYYEPEDVPPAGSEPVYVTVNNVVKSYDYIEGVTDLTEYTNEITRRSQDYLNLNVPEDALNYLIWTELRSDKVILTLQIKEMQFLKPNVRELLKIYGNMRDAWYEFAGLSTENQPPLRVYTDIQLPNANQKLLKDNEQRAGGYPIGVLRAHDANAGRYDSYVDEKKMVNDANELTFDVNSTWMAIPYSFGLTVLSEWSKAAFLQFPVLKMANLYYARTRLNKWLPSINQIAFDTWIRQNQTGVKANTTAYLGRKKGTESYGMFMRTNDPLRNADHTNAYETNDDWTRRLEHLRASMFGHLIWKYGWGLMAYVNQRSTELGFVNEYEQDCLDFFVMAACEYTNSNLTPFFNWWHYLYSPYANDFAMQFPPMERDASGKYFFETSAPDFPREPDFPSPDYKLTPNPVDAWPQKPYYRQVAKSNPGTANGWAIKNFVLAVKEGKIGNTTYKINDTIRRPGGNNLIDNDYSNATIFDQQKTVGTDETALNYNLIELTFPKDLTFNAIEITQAGIADEYPQWLWGFEIWVIDPVTLKGKWEPVNTVNQNPMADFQAANTEAKRKAVDWYTNVIWLDRFIQGGNSRDFNRATYFIMKTVTTTKFRFRMQGAISDNRIGNTGVDVGTWQTRMREIDLGLLSTDVPRPGSLMPQHSYIKKSIRSYGL